MLRTRRPILVEDVPRDPRVINREWLSRKNVATLLQVPLLLGEILIGWLSIYSATPRRFEPEEIELAQALAQQATLSLQLTRLAEQNQQTAVLSERNRIAREIHDTLAQGLAGIVVQLDAAEDVLPEEAQESLAHLFRARALARTSLTEARRSVRALRPEALEQANLADALASLVHQMTQDAPVRAEFHGRGARRQLLPEVEGNLLRIGQEALMNALRHAHASMIHVELSFEADGVSLAVQDDGHGFDPISVPGTHCFGLRGMRERAENIGGQLTVSSAPGERTRVVVVVPSSPME